MLDWESVANAIRRGGAVSFDCSESDRMIAWDAMLHNTNLPCGVESRYDFRTHKFWLWGTERNPFHSDYRSVVGVKEEDLPMTRGDD